MNPALIYFADPMCSWCWGFSPVIEQLRERYADAFDITLILGGLAPGTSEPLDAYRKDTIRSHWQHVTELSGQTFDPGFFDRDDFVYDTEPACRATVTVRTILPGTEFDYLRSLHEAFYTGNRDITDAETLADVAAQCGADAEQFSNAYHDPKTALATGNDFSITQSAGIKGFPAVVVGNESTGLAAITVGYQDYAAVATAIDGWQQQNG